MTSDTAIAPGLAAGWCRWCSLPTLLLLLLLLPVCVVQVESSSEASPLSPTLLAFSERFLELLIDLLSQLPTRRFFKAVLQVCTRPGQLPPNPAPAQLSPNPAPCHLVTRRLVS